MLTAEKSDKKAYKGRHPFSSKTVIHNKATEQVISVNYVRNLKSYGKEVDSDNKLNNYFKIICHMQYFYTTQNKNKIIQHTSSFPQTY